MVEVKITRIKFRDGNCYINGRKAERAEDYGCRGPKFRGSRIIVKMGKTARCALSHLYGEQCSKECDIWDELSAEDRKYFAPILASGTIVWKDPKRKGKRAYRYEWCAMEYIKGMDEQSRPNLLSWLADRYSFCDTHSGNWMICKKRKHLVIIDYGM